MTWEPIGTAPKDNRSIIGFDPLNGTPPGRILTMLWDAEDQTWRADIHSFIRFNPTHWMPLPEGPST